MDENPVCVGWRDVYIYIYIVFVCIHTYIQVVSRHQWNPPRKHTLTNTPHPKTTTKTTPNNRLPPLSKFYMRYMALGAFIVIVAAWQK